LLLGNLGIATGDLRGMLGDGVVEGVDGGVVATVRFERTGTATIVGDEEVSIIPSDVENMA
jgi:hypothetical protein